MREQQRSEHYRAVLSQIQQNAERLVTDHPDHFPTVQSNGDWAPVDRVTADARWFAGILWQLYLCEPSDKWRNRATYYSQLLLDSAKAMPSLQTWAVFHPWYRQTKDAVANRVLIEHGQQLGNRFRRRGQFLGGIDSSDQLSLRAMLDVPLMFHAANETLDQDLGRFATAHCRTTRDNLLDAGKVHVDATYDEEQKSFSVDTGPCPPLQLAMAIRGYSHVYEVTHIGETLDVAERVGQIWVEQLPEDRVPAVELESGTKDMLAATLACSALLDLCNQSSLPSHRLVFRTTALATLDAITVEAFADQLQSIETQYFLTESLVKVVMNG